MVGNVSYRSTNTNMTFTRVCGVCVTSTRVAPVERTIGNGWSRRTHDGLGALGTGRHGCGRSTSIVVQTMVEIHSTMWRMYTKLWGKEGPFLRRRFFAFLVLYPGLWPLVSRAESEYPGLDRYHIGIMFPICDTTTFFYPPSPPPKGITWYELIFSSITWHFS